MRLLGLNAVAVVTALGLAACGSATEKTKTVTVGSEAQGGAKTTPAPSSSASDDPSTTATPAAATDKPVAPGRMGDLDGKPVKVEITQLARRGSITNLSVRLTNTAPAPVPGDEPGDPISSSGDFPATGAGALDDAQYLFSGPYLVDGVNQKKYPVARDSKGNYLADDTGGLTIDPGSSITLSAQLGAPPPDVKKVDVFVPKIGTFTDVPLG